MTSASIGFLSKASAPHALAVLLILIGVVACESTSGVAARSRAKPEQPLAPSETGLASYYASKYHGKPTACGERFDMRAMTAAHPRLPFGTRVKVTCPANRRSVVVRINDRGPFVPGRVIDLSLAAAQELGMVQQGLAQVRLEIVR